MKQVISSHNQVDFDFLKSFKRIIVSGPQRSGTNLASQFLEHNLKYKYIDELEFDFYLESHFMKSLELNSEVIIQAPTMSHILHLIRTPSTFVFFCIRDVSDIVKSEDKIRWSGHRFERRNYSQDEYSMLPISQAKYDYWFFKQRPLMTSPFCEIYFSSFRDSAVWVEDRETGKVQPDVSWKPETSNDSGDRWSYVQTDKGPRSLKSVDYWFENEDTIESCMIPRTNQCANKGQKGQSIAE